MQLINCLKTWRTNYSTHISHGSKQRRAYQELIVIIQIANQIWLSLEPARTDRQHTYRVHPCAGCEFFSSDDILSSLRNKWGDIFLPHFHETLQEDKLYLCFFLEKKQATWHKQGNGDT